MAFIAVAFVARLAYFTTSVAAFESAWTVLRTIIVWHFFGTTALLSFTGGAAPNVAPVMAAALVAVFLAAKAALAGSGALSRRTLSWRAVAALVGGLGSAVGVLVVDVLLIYTGVHGDSDHILVVAAAVTVTGLVVVRQLVAFSENNTLLHQLGRQERRLRHEATHDALTGLANRALFNERLQAALGAIGENTRLNVALIDLDDFKTVNDTLGHAVGDGLLIAIAERLRKTVRVDEHLLVVGASLGVVAADAIDTRSVDATDGVDLLRCADIAMYQAKAPDAFIPPPRRQG